MKNDISKIYKNPNQTYTGIDAEILKDDYKAIAERELLYEQSYRNYFSEDGQRLTFRDPYPEKEEYEKTNRKNMNLGTENPGRSLEEFLGECDVCE